MHVVEEYVLGTCLSLVQCTHSVPAEVILIVLAGNLSIQVTQVDICKAAIPEWKLLIFKETSGWLRRGWGKDIFGL